MLSILFMYLHFPFTFLVRFKSNSTRKGKGKGKPCCLEGGFCTIKVEIDFEIWILNSKKVSTVPWIIEEYISIKINWKYFMH